MFKKFIKKIICFSLILSMSFTLISPLCVKAEEGTLGKTSPINVDSDSRITKNITERIPKSATQFVHQNYKEIIDVVMLHIDQFNVESSNLIDLKLGNPYVIYDLDIDKQDEIYFYPVLKDHTVVLVISIMGTTNGWNLSANEDMVSKLNKISYDKMDYIFYESNGNIVAENSEVFSVLSGQENQLCHNFKSFDFNHKIELISSRIKEFVKTDTSIKIDPNIKHLEKATLTLYNQQGQGSYGMCWAASVATIINYLKRTNITAMNVCDREGVGYDEGGDISLKQKALLDYGIYYDYVLYRQASWSEITKNIDNGKPLAASSHYSSERFHAVTIYGYQMFSTNDYITIWNSGLNSGAGGSQIIYYNPLGSTFDYGNATYTLFRSLCYEI